MESKKAKNVTFKILKINNLKTIQMYKIKTITKMKTNLTLMNDKDKTAMVQMKN